MFLSLTTTLLAIGGWNMKKNVIARWASAFVIGSTLVAIPASASPSGSGVVINEIYVNGGSAGATYLNKYVELYNPTNQAIDLSGWSIQYRPATGVANFSGVTPLGTHHIEPHGTFVVSGNSNAANGAALPTPDVVGTTSFSGSTGTIALSKSTTPLTGAPAAVLADSNLVDLIGYGTSNTFETAVKASGTSVTSSLQRTAGTDTDNNSADFTAGTPLAEPCGDTCDGSGTPVEPPVDATIEQIQGDGATSPLVGKQVTTKGVVTADYSSGGFSGAYIQTDGTGGDIDLGTHTTSDGIFVFSTAFASAVHTGELVSVTGGVSEFNGMTELSTSAGNWSVLDTPVQGVTPAKVAFPMGEAQRESLEGMLLLPQGHYTITNNYTTNQYAEIGLASGTKPLETPTNVARPGTDAYNQVVADNARSLVTLDDGSSLNFLSAANQSTPVPWLTPDNEVRVGDPTTFDDPVVLDYRNDLWKLQPTQQLKAGGDEPVTFGNTRTAAPKDVGGAIRLATFNVLNYFTTTGEDYTGGTCTYYKDRAGNNLTVNECTNNGPRGAASAANLARQQAKIVAAINKLGADVVSLEEIENSVQFGLDRDASLNQLVDALNAAAGAGTWAAVQSPDAVPTAEDVIRTGFIYKPAKLQTVGASKILIGATAFDNAREPLAQAFKPVGGGAGSTFAVIVNHFKSKSSSSLPQDADQGDGQGASNYSRTLQAHALLDFADQVKQDAGTNTLFLSGDFNSYNQEDPVKIIEDAGYINVPEKLAGDKETYQFDGMVGSLDHVFATPEAFDKVSGADIWNINSYESVAREYSRYNNNVTDFYQPTPYRASDHDPEVVGFSPASHIGKVTATVGPTRYGHAGVITLTAKPGSYAVAYVTEGHATVGVGAIVDGRGHAALDPRFKVGTHHLVIHVIGDKSIGNQDIPIDLVVTK
jgi:5'-nucleotidase